MRECMQNFQKKRYLLEHVGHCVLTRYFYRYRQGSFTSLLLCLKCLTSVHMALLGINGRFHKTVGCIQQTSRKQNTSRTDYDIDGTQHIHHLPYTYILTAVRLMCR